MAPQTDPTNRLDGYRMPPEWAPHRGTWISWPHNPDTWPGCLDKVEASMLDVVAALGEFETVHINVLDSGQERYLEQRLAKRVARGSVQMHRIRTNDAWCRDHGAIFVVGGAGAETPLAAHKFGYNAWGGKYPPYDLDQAVAAQMAAALDVPCIEHAMILEGGSIDVNGEGTLLTTEQCLLNANRNPDLDRAMIEQELKDAFGIERIVWLGEGIQGDDTDGHIDEITRFVTAGTVITAIEPNRDDPNFIPLQANRQSLERVRLSDGTALEIIDLPMPEPVHYRGARLPASYANFYIANDLVLVPEFGVAGDAAAAAVLADCFPGRHVVGIDCRYLVAGLGGLHCLTQQVPVSDVRLS